MTQKTNNVALYILMFNMFITMGGVGLIIPVMPKYLELFNAGGQVYGLLIGGFALAQFLFSPIAGDLSDRYGRKNFIIFGLALLGVSQIMFAFADAIWLLFISRFLSGMGAAFVMPPIMAFVADITTFEERGKGMGMIGASISLGFTIGPAVGGLLSGINLTFPFYFAGVSAFLAALLSYFVLPNIKPKVTETAPVPRENLVKQMVKSTKAPYFMFLIVVFTFSFGIANFQATLSLYLNDKFNYSPFDISVIITVGGFIGVLLQVFVVDRLFKKYGEMNVILVNLFVASVMILLVIYVHTFFMVLLVSTLFSIATTFIRPAVNTLISKVAGNEQGFAAGMNNAYMSLGNMFGPVLAGVLYDWNMNSPYILGCIVLFACLIMAWSWTYTKAPYLFKPSK